MAVEQPDARTRLLIFVKHATEASPRAFLVEQPSADSVSEFALTALEGHEFESKGEAAGQDVLVSLILRLTEKELAVLFQRLCEWGRQKQQEDEIVVEKIDEKWDTNLHCGRKVAFLGALHAMGERLRALAVPFLVRTWPDIMQSLRCPHVQPSINDGDSNRGSTVPAAASSLDLNMNRGKKRKCSTVEGGRGNNVMETDEVANCIADRWYAAQVSRALACATLCVQHDQHDESRGDGLLGNDRFEVSLFFEGMIDVGIVKQQYFF